MRNLEKKWLNDEELQAIFAAAKKQGIRNYLIILLSYRHALRAGEVGMLRYDWINSRDNSIWIERLKSSISTSHPLASDELRLIKRLKKTAMSDIIFPLTPRRISQIAKEIGINAGMKTFHHHQLRHTCAYSLANRKVDPLTLKNYLGHCDIRNTMIYINAAGRNFSDLPRLLQ